MRSIQLQTAFLIAICLVAVGFSAPAQGSLVDTDGDLANFGKGDERVSYYREIPAVWPSYVWPRKPGLDCRKLENAECWVNPKYGGHGFIVAPLCQEVNTNFCVEEFYAVDESGVKFVAEPTTGVNQEINPPFTVRTKSSTLQSGNPSLWKFPQSFSDQRDYLVNAFTMVQWEPGDKIVALTGIELAVSPVTLESRSKYPVEKNLPDGFRFGVRLRLDWEVGGFLMGRISSSKVSQKTIKPGVSRSVLIEAAPEEVPKISGRNLRGRIAYSMEDYVFFRDQSTILGDVATNVDRVFRAYSRKTLDYSCAGFNSGFYGTGTTNAAMYAVDPPNFNRGSLNYEVASIHYLPDGKSLNLGKYEMALRSDVARCIYGLSKSPISASIQVVNSNGEKAVATTVVSEKNGWLKLAAYGFTFSKKKISIKLNNKKRR